MRKALLKVLPAAMLAATFVAAIPAQAQQKLERPPGYDPARIPGIRSAGPNYQIANPVRSDGFMRIYVVKTKLGDSAVIGDALMRQRIIEMAALAELNRISNSDTFNKSLVDAGLSPIKYAAARSCDPAGQKRSATRSPASARCSARLAPA